ncbi:sugar-binding protein [Actinomadura sp. DC4]|uniref:sugar-binding protein n=1 Tax=Actinomadura sp. DC4 TaxID=3055069 RepID=UPI0025AFC811|nr:sugar-binding protein [Actinomadura sp. DC4]MDN3351674.1 sugar-binding protein [Actinomadura sp. DC4]
MRGGLAAPMALAAGMVLALLPATVPPAPRHPPAPQSRPGRIAPAQSAWDQAAYARPAAAVHETPAAAHAPARDAAAPAKSGPGKRPDLDVLFVGAHPDDESGDLSTFGQWNERRRVRTGVLTITRGEGGGNAVGTEEGPALGLLREAEERKAVARAGIEDIDYLDKADFYYTVSDDLTRDVWDHDSALAKVVRLIRETRPKVITTMTPSPIPGQHGNHQEAGRLAVEAYYLAADPTAFPSQLTKEHLRIWRAGRLLHQEHLVTAGTGPACETTFTPTDPSADVYGVWAGRTSRQGGTWAQIEAEAKRFYASQGWANTPDAPGDPNQIGCDYLTQVDSRVPFTRGEHGPDAALEGALYPAEGGLPLGTEFYLTTSAFSVPPGEPFTVTAHAPSGHVALSLPAGWTATGSGSVRRGLARFSVTPSGPAGRVRLGATVTTRHGSGTTGRAVEVTDPVTGVQQPLPRVADFDAWAKSTGVPQLSGRVKRVLTLASGGSRTVRVDLADTTDEAREGTVTLNLPPGFTADAASRPYSLAAGATGSVTFTVRDADASLPTSDQGGTAGDYDYTITTTVQGAATDTSHAALELVPATTIPQASSAPSVDGQESSGEYSGPSLDLSRLWEGTPCSSAGDCSATGKVTWYDDALYVLVQVKDDKPGSVLDAADCKRHWRTDSVEIGLDPRGDAENTATTFKTGILPSTTGGGPCFERDADNHQGPGAETAPGMKVASSVSSPYTGYTVETKIPLADLPAAVDPSRLAMDIFVYDSDTTDKTGQTRVGWSTWGGVQGDPYRWGLATLPGYTPPPDRPTTAPPPVMPKTAALSVDSPQSIIEAASTGVPLAAGPAASASVRLVGRPRLAGGSVTFRLRTTAPGTVHAYVWDGRVLGQRTVDVPAGTSTVTVPGTSGTLAVAFSAGGTKSLAVPLR